MRPPPEGGGVLGGQAAGAPAPAPSWGQGAVGAGGAVGRKADGGAGRRPRPAAPRDRLGGVGVMGTQPAGAPAMALSWSQGTVVETDAIDTIADGVAGRCPIPEVLEDLLVVLDDMVLVREDSIRAGMRAVHEHAGLVVEP